MSDIKKDKSALTIKDIDERYRLIFSSFLKNEHHTFIVQKSEKLASALYMVTGFVPDNDPLKTHLRTYALELMSVSTDPVGGRGERLQEKFTSRCLEIGSALRIAERAGFISSMNAEVLCDEYTELASFVQNHRDKIFGVRTVDMHRGGAERLSDGGSAGKTRTPATSNQKDRQFKRTDDSLRHSKRRFLILGLLDKKDKITVRDAMLVVDGCSEKTIQRELISLVQEGVLLKEGKRRWSAYRKVQSA